MIAFYLNIQVDFSSHGLSYDQAYLVSASAGGSLQGAGSDETAETTAALNNVNKGAHDSKAPDNKASHDPAPSRKVIRQSLTDTNYRDRSLLPFASWPLCSPQWSGSDLAHIYAYDRICMCCFS